MTIMNQSKQAVRESDSNIIEYRMILAKRLVVSLETNNNQNAEEIIHELSVFRETNLYQQLDKLTRTVHDSINSFGDKGSDENQSISDINVNQDLENARDNLEYVMKLSEESAHQVINAVEHSKPLSEKLNIGADKLLTQIKGANNESQSLKVINDISGYLKEVTSDVGVIDKNLNDILLAQGNQDISGQIIQRVMAIVQDIKDGRVEILHGNQELVECNNLKETVKHVDDIGPIVPSVINTEVLNNQSEVDDLLYSLGF